MFRGLSLRIRPQNMGKAGSIKRCLIAQLFLLQGLWLPAHADDSSQNGKTQCPQQWDASGGNCYRVFGFDPPERKFWQDAKRHCRQLESRLVSIHNENEQTFLEKYLKNIRSDIWIGLHNNDPRENEKVFQWSDGSDFIYPNWHHDEPGFNYGKGDCGLMKYELHFGMWFDFDCKTELPYICKNPKVNGGWSEWSEWSPCPVTCGTGVMQRTRSCDNPKPLFEGSGCVGNSTEEEICDAGKNCPVNGGWSEWSEWSPCPVTCGTGVIQRTRSCDNPKPLFGGSDCVGNSTEEETCEAGKNCPVNGGWSDWSEWSPCSVACGTGVMQRTRSCDNPKPLFGGSVCVGNSTEEEICDAGKNCPGNCGGSIVADKGNIVSPNYPEKYGTNETCIWNITVPEGYKVRLTFQDFQLEEDESCSYDYVQISDVSKLTCPVLGKFCGQNIPNYVVSSRNEVKIEFKSDYEEEFRGFSINFNKAGRCSGWLKWSEWSPCYATCGVSYQHRTRRPKNSSESQALRMCKGKHVEITLCDDLKECPVNGQWSEWSEWSACPVTCGTAKIRRTRTCDDPPPQFGGSNCTGNSEEVKTCDPGNPCRGIRCSAHSCKHGERCLQYEKNGVFMCWCIGRYEVVTTCKERVQGISRTGGGILPIRVSG